MIDTTRYTIAWQVERGCSTCGQSVVLEEHRFQGGDESWGYIAPLYHDAEHNLGFCSIECCMENVKLRYPKKPA